MQCGHKVGEHPVTPRGKEGVRELGVTELRNGNGDVLTVTSKERGNCPGLRHSGKVREHGPQPAGSQRLQGVREAAAQRHSGRGHPGKLTTLPQDTAGTPDPCSPLPGVGQWWAPPRL